MTCRWAEKRQRPAAPQYGCRPTIYTYRAWAYVRPTDVAYMGPPVMPMGFLPRQKKKQPARNSANTIPSYNGKMRKIWIFEGFNWWTSFEKRYSINKVMNFQIIIKKERRFCDSRKHFFATSNVKFLTLFLSQHVLFCS